MDSHHLICLKLIYFTKELVKSSLFRCGKLPVEPPKRLTVMTVKCGSTNYEYSKAKYTFTAHLADFYL